MGTHYCVVSVELLFRLHKTMTNKVATISWMCNEHMIPINKELIMLAHWLPMCWNLFSKFDIYHYACSTEETFR